MFKRDKNGRFIKGNGVGNTYALGNPPNRTSFKKGNVPKNFKGVFVPRVIKTLRDGIQVDVTLQETKDITVKNRKITTKKRTSYARYIYGIDNIPSGMVIWHIDGNVLNNNPNNLKAITRAQLLKINQQKRRNK